MLVDLFLLLLLLLAPLDVAASSATRPHASYEVLPQPECCQPQNSTGEWIQPSLYGSTMVGSNTMMQTCITGDPDCSIFTSTSTRSQLLRVYNFSLADVVPPGSTIDGFEANFVNVNFGQAQCSANLRAYFSTQRGSLNGTGALYSSSGDCVRMFTLGESDLRYANTDEANFAFNLTADIVRSLDFGLVMETMGTPEFFHAFTGVTVYFTPPPTMAPSTASPTTRAPTVAPTTRAPTVAPTTRAPTVAPTLSPTMAPAILSAGVAIVGNLTLPNSETFVTLETDGDPPVMVEGICTLDGTLDLILNSVSEDSKIDVLDCGQGIVGDFATVNVASASGCMYNAEVQKEGTQVSVLVGAAIPDQDSCQTGLPVWAIAVISAAAVAMGVALVISIVCIVNHRKSKLGDRMRRELHARDAEMATVALERQENMRQNTSQ